MPCKPMHKRNGLDTRQAVWEAIRRLGTFTLRQLREETLLSMDSVREYVTGLHAAGYIGKEGCHVQGYAGQWNLVKDIGIEAPRVRKDGSPVTQGQGRENMWNAMLIMRTFSARELAVAACTKDCYVKESTAADYAKHLCHAGYLTKRPGGSYQMLPSAYTGPRPPMVQRTKVVWDPNQQQVRWRSDVEVSDDE